MHNFMLEDLAGSLRAIGLFPLFLVVPGYAFGWWGDLFEFRRRTALFRLAASVPLSVGLCPILTYLAGRISMNAVWALYGILAAAFVVAVARTNRTRGTRRPSLRTLWPFAVVVAVWLAVALFSLVDLEWGRRVYYPVSSIDNSVRSAYINAIATDGTAPDNPFFSPGHPVPLRYHYFWFILCSLAERAGAPGVTARQALIGGTFWCGVGMLALLALYLRLFVPHDAPRFRSRMLIGCLLLGITGLDIIPSIYLEMQYFKGALPFVLPSVEWWNEHVDWFVYTALWAPHALGSLVAGLLAFLLLWKAPEAQGRGGWVRYSLAAAVALASSAGECVYVAIVLAVFLVIWTGVTAWKKWVRETAALLLAGIACVILALPYFAGLRGPAAEGYGAEPFQLTVRAFSFAALIPWSHGMKEWTRLLLVNLPLLPVNYLLELGLFFIAGAVQWRKFRRREEPLSRYELASILMAAVSILICTFVRSSVVARNDLGWRGFLPAQFILLLWAIDLIPERRPLVTLFLILGAAGSVYDLALTRFYPVLADHGVIPPLDWMSPDRRFGERTYAERAAYEWTRDYTPPTASIQFNPKVVFQETPAMMYADRRMVAGDLQCNTAVGGDPRQCAPIVSRLKALYASGGPSDFADACSNVPMDVVVAKDTDPVWANRQSWVWRIKPVFGNSYVRLFRCRDALIWARR